MRKTKVICTVGPACTDKETLRKMIQNGMNVARLNFSHQSYDFHRENIQTLKELREEMGVPLGILLDTKGPEIRTGEVKGGSVELKTGDEFILTTDMIEGDEKRTSVNRPNLPTALKRGDTVLLDDGKIELVVEDIDGNNIYCRIKNGGMLGNTRGVNVPGVFLPTPFLSGKDRADLLFGIQNGIDFVAASFVRSAQDVLDMRAFLNANGGSDIKIISKIESSLGIDCFDEILAVSDGIMVARGDMGVEIPYERLPAVQKQIIRRCFLSGKPAITATQMLESMIDSRTPTRAEINDVANAVFDATSAVMLSGETAIGTDPARVVEVMTKICENAEKSAAELDTYARFGRPDRQDSVTDAVCDAAVRAASDWNADAIIAVTHNGDTARMMSKYRPASMVIGATDNERAFHQLALSWGVVPMKTGLQTDTDALFEHVIRRAVDEELLCRGKRAVITMGTPVGESGGTNTVRLTRL